MKNIVLIICFLVAVACVQPARADDYQSDPRMKAAQTWLSNLKTATSRFEQIDNDGNVMRGTFYISRPGRLRFEYDAPIQDYIVADGYLIHFYDGESGQANNAPIGSTLADFILRDGDHFDDKVTIEWIRSNDKFDRIALSQSDQPGMGELILQFQKNPYQLQSWSIIDAQGLETTLVLNGLKQGVDIDPTLFTMQNLKLNE